MRIHASILLKELNTFPRTYDVLVKGPSAYRYAFLTPLVLELELLNLFVGEAHHVMGQHGAVLDQLLDFYFSKNTDRGARLSVTPRNYYPGATCD